MNLVPVHRLIRALLIAITLWMARRIGITDDFIMRVVAPEIARAIADILTSGIRRVVQAWRERRGREDLS